MNTNNLPWLEMLAGDIQEKIEKLSQEADSHRDGYLYYTEHGSGQISLSGHTDAQMAILFKDAWDLALGELAGLTMTLADLEKDIQQIKGEK